MAKLFVYLLLLGCVLYLLWMWGRHQQLTGGVEGGGKPKGRFRGKKNPQEMWVQVYETADLNEAKMIQARLQEEDLDCIVYEQGKKDIHGNEPKGVGVAVPKSGIGRAQSVISRMPV